MKKIKSFFYQVFNRDSLIKIILIEIIIVLFIIMSGGLRVKIDLDTYQNVTLDGALTIYN